MINWIKINEKYFRNFWIWQVQVMITILILIFQKNLVYHVNPVNKVS